MPFDDRILPTETPQITVSRNDRNVAIWLFTICAMILVMIVLGGATRLTGSGLSIMEWAPIMGALPPLGEAEWQRLYRLYQQIPQYDLMNKGFGLAGFKQIFWLEWTHRLWGRLLGVAFIGPLIWLAWCGAIGRRLLPRLLLLFVLGGLQGAVGWFMVASGFLPESTAVSPYRLVAHLALALTLYAVVFWTAMSVWRPVALLAEPVLRRLAIAVVALVSTTIVAGGFVAGLHAGLTYNTFPLMDGRLVPTGFAELSPFVRNLTENIAAVQFDHRLLASLTGVLAIATVAYGLARADGTGRAAVLALAVAVGGQYVLGVATLLYVVPVALAVAHQTMAVLVLTAALGLLHAVRRSR